MSGVINLQPQVVNLMLYAGDGASLRLVCTNNTGTPIDITGEVKAQIRVNRRDDTTPIAEFAVNMTDAYQGIVILSLTGDQTEALMDQPSVSNDKFTGVWDIEWDPSGLEPRTICQGKVECVADVTRE